MRTTQNCPWMCRDRGQAVQVRREGERPSLASWAHGHGPRWFPWAGARTAHGDRRGSALMQPWLQQRHPTLGLHCPHCLQSRTAQLDMTGSTRTPMGDSRATSHPPAHPTHPLSTNTYTTAPGSDHQCHTSAVQWKALYSKAPHVKSRAASPNRHSLARCKPDPMARPYLEASPLEVLRLAGCCPPPLALTPDPPPPPPPPPPRLVDAAPAAAPSPSSDWSPSSLPC